MKSFSSIGAVWSSNATASRKCAVDEVDAALARVMGRLDTLCRRHDCNQVVSDLLKQFDVLTGLSAWSDPKTYH